MSNEVVIAGDTAAVTLSFTGGGSVTNFGFIMSYDDTVVDESGIVATCDNTAVGLSDLICAVDTTANIIAGIGVNLPLTPLVSGDFASLSLPVLPGAASGDSINPIEVVLSASGNVTIANSSWTLTVTAAQLSQTISNFVVSPAPLTYLGSNGTLSATASSGLMVSDFGYISGPCTVLGDQVTATGAGTCQVSANQAGNGFYDPAPQVVLNIQINQASQTISPFTAVPDSACVSSISVLDAISSSGLAVSFGSDTPAICTVSGDIVNYLALGTCTLSASQAGDANYLAAATVLLDVTVGNTCPTTCNNVVASGTIATGEIFEACERLSTDVSFNLTENATVVLSAGEGITLGAGFTVETGGILQAKVCGQSLCEASPEPMEYGCHSCVTQICDAMPSCCDTVFTAACQAMVNTTCSLSCE